MSTQPNARLQLVGQSPAVTLQQGAVRRQPFPAAASFDDDLVAGVGQPVQSAAARIGSVKRLSHSPTARLLLMTDLAFLHKPVYVMTLGRTTAGIKRGFAATLPNGYA